MLESPFDTSQSTDLLLNIITVLMLYGPAYLANTGAMLFGKWLPDKFGFPNHKIDSGRNYSDGNRLLGDGKSWEGMFGGALFSGLLMVFANILWDGRYTPDSRPFIDPLLGASSNDWYWIYGENSAAFILGFSLGLACMIGDTAGSFVKRRQGHKREGDESSKAPLLDTMPFALFIFLAALLLFNDEIIMHNDLHSAIIALLILTPIIHRTFNILGYKLGLKSVPY
tara:strand:- start:19171 stop:19848 length:678 start_codon:yes stop_codon:yes gene_type:complete